MSCVVHNDYVLPDGTVFAQRCYYVPRQLPEQTSASQSERKLDLLVRRVYSVMVVSLRAIKDTLGDNNATSDLLRLYVNLTGLLQTYFPIPNLKLLSAAFTAILDFISARSCLSRGFDILSGEAATKELLAGGWDYLRVSSKLFYLVNDVCNTAKWLVSIKVLEGIVGNQIGTIQIFGFVVSLTMKRISVVATIAGTIPNLIDNALLVYQYFYEDPGMLKGVRKGKFVEYSFDTVMDICRLASTVLFCCSNPWFLLLGTVVGTIGTTSSFVKFHYKNYVLPFREQERIEFNRIKDEAMGGCKTLLGEVAREKNHQNAEANPRAIRLLEKILRNMEKTDKQIIQEMTPEQLKDLLLLKAKESIPQLDAEPVGLQSIQVKRSSQAVLRRVGEIVVEPGPVPTLEDDMDIANEQIVEAYNRQTRLIVSDVIELKQLQKGKRV